jgi:hypothetical protein
VFTSLILILHPRIGGAATARCWRTAMGLIGFGLAIVVMHLARKPLGSRGGALACACDLRGLESRAVGLRRIALRRASFFFPAFASAHTAPRAPPSATSRRD